MTTEAEKKALTELLTFCFEPGEIHGRNEIGTAIVMLEILLDQYRPTITIPVSECCKGKIDFIKGSLKVGYHQCCSCGKEVKGQVLESYMSFLQTIPNKWIITQALQLAELFPEEKQIAYRISGEVIKHLIRRGFDVLKPVNLPEQLTDEAIDTKYPLIFGMEMIPSNEYRREGAKAIRDLIFNNK